MKGKREKWKKHKKKYGMREEEKGVRQGKREEKERKKGKFR
jgi:hypothetical protein